MDKSWRSSRSVLELEPDTHDKVSFNYPKYRDKGVPYDVWMRNVNTVEEDLENITIKENVTQPDNQTVVEPPKEEQMGDNIWIISMPLVRMFSLPT